MRTLCDRLWNGTSEIFIAWTTFLGSTTTCTTWSRVVTSDFNSVLSNAALDMVRLYYVNMWPVVQYHGVTTVYHGVSRYTTCTVYHGVPRCTTVYHSIPRCITVYHGDGCTHWYTTMYHGVLLCTTVYHIRVKHFIPHQLSQFSGRINWQDCCCFFGMKR